MLRPAPAIIPQQEAAMQADDAVAREAMVSVPTDPGQTLREAVVALGPAVVGPIFLDMTNGLAMEDVMGLLDHVALEAPDAANAWLTVALESGRLTPWETEDAQGRTLRLGERAWITSLPEELFVDGGLDLHGCMSLKALPVAMDVAGNLDCGGCASLTTLPDHLEVGGYLNLRGCVDLTWLSEHLVVGGGIALDDCPSWDGLFPEGTSVASEIYTDAHPEGILLDDWRDQHPRGEFDESARGMGTLDFMGAALGDAAATLGRDEAMPVLEDAVTGLAPRAVLHLLDQVAQAAPGVANDWLGVALDQGWIAPWDEDGWHGLHFAGRDWITSLPEDLFAEGGVDLHGCASLQTLPIAMEVSGDFDLSGCVSISSLPDHLEVGGSADFRGCPRLTWLSDHLVVGGSLDLVDCPSWDGLVQPGAYVAGGLSTDSHPEGIALEDWRLWHPFGEFH